MATIDPHGRRVESRLAVNALTVAAVIAMCGALVAGGHAIGQRSAVHAHMADCMTPHEARLLTTWVSDTLRVELPRRIERVRIVADALEAWLPDASAEERRLMVHALTMGGAE